MIFPIIIGTSLIIVCVLVTKVLLKNGEDELAVFNAIGFAVMMFLIIMLVIGARQQQKGSKYEKIEEPLYRLKQ